MRMASTPPRPRAGLVRQVAEGGNTATIQFARCSASSSPAAGYAGNPMDQFPRHHRVPPTPASLLPLLMYGATACQAGPDADRQGSEASTSETGAEMPAEWAGHSGHAAVETEFAWYRRVHTTLQSDGTWLVEGDLKVATEEGVRAMYDAFVFRHTPPQDSREADQSADWLAGWDSADVIQTTETSPRSTTNSLSAGAPGPQEAGVGVENGLDVTLDVHRKLNLTYCFGSLALESTYNDLGEAEIIRIAREVAGEWEHGVDVNFVHLPEFDDTDGGFGAHGACCPPPTAPGAPGCPQNSSLYFRIRVADQAECNPNECNGFVTFLGSRPPVAPNVRELAIGLRSLGTKEDLQALFRHEFGHILGLQHEHARYEDQQEVTCQGDPQVALTEYDKDSVMSYDYCDGVNEGNDEISVLDRLGAAYLYNLPHEPTTGDYGMAPGPPFNITDDVFWYSPNNSKYYVWLGIPGADIDFHEVETCYATAGCPPLVGNLKPFSLNTGGDFFQDVFLYGPYADYPDRLLKSLGNGIFEVHNKSVTVSRYVPTVLPAHAAATDDILFYRPGSGNDVMWHPSTPTNFASVGVSATDYYFPVSGRFAGVQWQTMWYRPMNVSSPVWTWTGEHVKATSSTNHNGLAGGLAYVPLVGEFVNDAIGFEEIAWYAPFAEDVGDRLVVWDRLPSQNAAVFSFASGVPRYMKAVVGRFDVPGPRDQILFYADDDDGGTNQVWDLDLPNGANIEYSLPVLGGDFSAVVGDFNGDSCDDILWFAPHAMTSRVWRSDCDGNFDEVEPVAHPASAYPVGYGVGYMRPL